MEIYINRQRGWIRGRRTEREMVFNYKLHEKGSHSNLNYTLKCYLIHVGFFLIRKVKVFV